MWFYCITPMAILGFLISLLIWSSLVVAKRHDIERGLDYTQVLHTMD